MASFSSLISIVGAIIAVVALIIAIMANGKKQKEIMPTIKTENGEEARFNVALKNYVKTEEGKEFMVSYLKEDIGDEGIKDVMNNALTSTKKYYPKFAKTDTKAGNSQGINDAQFSYPYWHHTGDAGTIEMWWLPTGKAKLTGVGMAVQQFEEYK